MGNLYGFMKTGRSNNSDIQKGKKMAPHIIFTRVDR